MNNRKYIILSFIFLVIFLISGLTTAAEEGKDVNLISGKAKFVVAGGGEYPFFDLMFDEKETPYLPLSEVLEKLQLTAFKIDWEQKQVEGNITTDPKYAGINYRFDFGTGEMKNKSGKEKVASTKYLVKEKEIYLEYSILEDFLPVKISWDPVYYEIKLSPQFKLLSELQEERSEIREEAEKKDKDKVPEGKLKAPGEVMFDPGFFRYQTGVKTDFTELDFSGIRLEYFGPLLYGNFDSDLIISDFENQDFEFNLTYSDLWDNNMTNQVINNKQTRKLVSEDKLKGLFRGKKLILGDDFLLQPSLLAHSEKIRGVTVSNTESKHEYGTTSITGRVPKGSDVELHSKGVLIDYQKAEDGIYNFNNVEVVNRYDAYEVVVYTPEGRVYKEKKHIAGWSEQLSPGKIDYEGGIGQGQDGLAGNASIYYGVNEDLSLGGEIAAVTSEEKKETYLGNKIVYRDNLNRTYFMNSYFPSQFDGAAYQGGINQIFPDWVLEARLSGYKNIYPPQRQIEGIEGKKYGIDQSGKIMLKTNQVDYSLELEYQLNRYKDYYEYDIITDYRKELYDKFLLKDNFLLRIKNDFSSNLIGPWENKMRGEIYYSGWKNINSRLHSEVIFNNNELKNHQFGTKISLKEAFIDDLETSIDLTVNNGELFSWIRSEYELSDRTSVSARLNNDSVEIKFTFQEIRKAVPPFNRVSNDVSSHRGIVTGRVFQGYSNQREESLAGVEVKVDNRSRAKTDKEGRYIISNLRPYKPVKLSIAPASLDALYAPKHSEIWVKPIPGREVEVDFEIVPITGISGYVKGLDDLPEINREEVRIILKDKSGTVVKKAVPQFDGFYLLDKVKPGKYILTVEFPEGIDENINPEKYNIIIPAGSRPEWYDKQNFKIK